VGVGGPKKWGGWILISPLIGVIKAVYYHTSLVLSVFYNYIFELVWVLTI